MGLTVVVTEMTTDPEASKERIAAMTPSNSEQAEGWNAGIGVGLEVMLGGLGRGLARTSSKTGTVWDSIKITQAAKPGTKIPTSFEVFTSNGNFWVHPNATKHMVELVSRRPMTTMDSQGMRMINSQAMLNSFQSAVSDAASQGIRYGEIMRVGRWELIFSQGRSSDILPVVKHALYR